MPGVNETSAPADLAGAQSADIGSSSASESGVNWSNLADDDFGSQHDDSVAASLETPPPAPAPAPTPVQTPELQQGQQSPATPAAPAVPPGPSPTSSGEVPQAPAPAPAPNAPADDPVQLREQYSELLRSQDYAISPEDALAFVTEPETALPRFAAQVHLRIMRDVGQVVRAAMESVPSMMQSMVQEQQRDVQARSEFYSAWPGLESHHDTVLQTMQLVRNARPDATKTQVIEMTGSLVAVQLGVDPATLRGVAAQVAAPRQQPARPAAPAVPAGVGGSRAAGGVETRNIWDQLADSDLDD